MVKSVRLRRKILIVTAVPGTIRAFLLSYIEKLAVDYDVTVVCSNNDNALLHILPVNVRYHPLNISRKINLREDFIALFKLCWLITYDRFDLVQSVTPKAGLLAQLASIICCVPRRVHVFTGQVWATRTGLMKMILKTLDGLIARCATHVLADSLSQLKFLVDEKIVSAQKISVLGRGSICGVNTTRFRPNVESRLEFRNKLGYSEDDIVALFIGRLNRDKGIYDLVKAYCIAQTSMPKLKLLIVGPDEENLTIKLRELVAKQGGLKIFGTTAEPEHYMIAADIFCLPSYREGFGLAVIEAAACGLPTIASRIYGLTDAVEEQKSGLLHTPGAIDEIAQLLEGLALNAKRRHEMGMYARERAVSMFSEEFLLRERLNFIQALFSRDYTQ